MVTILVTLAYAEAPNPRGMHANTFKSMMHVCDATHATDRYKKLKLWKDPMAPDSPDAARLAR